MTRQANNLLALFDNWDTYKSTLESASNAEGTLQEQQDIYMESTRAHLDQLTAAAENFYDSFLDTKTINNFSDSLGWVLDRLASITDALGGGKGALLALGSTALKVFNQQIGKSIGVMVSRFRDAQSQAEILKTQLSMAEQYSNLGDSDIADIANRRAKRLQYGSVMTDDVKQSYDVGLEQYEQAILKQNEIKQAQQDSLNTIQQMATAAGVLDTEGINNYFEESGKQLGDLQDKVQTIKEEYLDLGAAEETETQKVQKTLDSLIAKEEELQRVLKASNIDPKNEELIKQYLLLDEEVKQLQQDLTKMFTSSADKNSFLEKIKQYKEILDPTAESTKELEKAIKELETAMGNTEDVDAQKAAVEKLGEALSHTRQKAKENVETLDENLDKGSRENLENAGRDRQNAGDFLGVQDKALDFSKKASEITQFIGVLGQLTSVLQSVADITKILRDDTLDTGEKAEQVMERLIIAAPMLVSGITAIIPALQSLTGAAEASLAAIAATSAGPFLIALTAIVAILPSAISLFNEFHMSAEEAKQQIDDLNNSMQSFKDTTDTYNNNVQSLRDMQSAYEELSKKAGAYDEHIDRLTDSEREQYNSMKNQLVELNGDLLAYYNDQGEAVLKNQDGIQITIDLLKEQYELEQKNLYTENYKENKKAFDKQYEDTKNSDASNQVARFKGTIESEKQQALDSINSLYDLYHDTTGKLFEAKDTLETVLRISSTDDLAKAVQDGNSDFSKAMQILAEDSKTANNPVFRALQQKVENIKEASSNLDTAEKAEQAGIEAASKVDTAWVMGVIRYNPGENAEYTQLKDQLGDQGTDFVDNIVSSYVDSLRLSDDMDMDDVIQAAKDFTASLNSLLFSGGDDSKTQSKMEDAKSVSADNIAGSYQDYLSTVEEKLNAVINDDDFKAWAAEHKTEAESILSSLIPDVSNVTLNDDGSLYNYVNSYEEKIKGLAEQINISNDNRGNTDKIEEHLSSLFSSEDLSNLDEIIDKFNELYSGTGEWVSALEAAKNSVEGINNISSSTNVTDLINNAIEASKNGVDVGSSYSDKLTELAEQYDNTSQELANFNRALESGNESALENATTMLELATKAGELADETGYDAETIEEYAKQLQGMDGVADTTGDVLAELAKKQARYDDAVNSNAENIDDWTNDLEVAQETGLLVADSAQEMREAYGNLLDIDGDLLSSSFLKDAENLQLMQDAINGSKEAYDELQRKANEDIMIGFGISQDSIDNFYANADSLLDSANFDDLEIGASLNDEAFLNELSNMLNDLDVGVDEAQSILEGLGIDAEVETATQENTTKHQYTNLVPTITSHEEKSVNPAAGYTPVTYNFPEVQYKAIPVETEETSTVAGSGIKVTSARKSSGGNVKFTNSTAGHGGSNSKKGSSSGGSGKKGSSGGSSSKAATPKTKDLNTDTLDRYHDINIKINDLSKSYSRLQKVQDKLTGKELIDNLNKQLAILEKQRDAYKEKIQLAKQEASEIKNSLANYGATFDANGEISNYATLLTQAQKNLNDVIGWYNSLSADAQDDAADKKVDAAQKEYDKIKELITDYDKLINETIPDLEDDITEALLSEIEIKIQEFDMEVSIRLDMGEAMRDWNEFKRKVIDDLNSDSLLGDALQNQADILSYYNTANTGIGSIQSLTAKIGNAATPGSILGELQKMQNGGHSSIYSAYDSTTGMWVDDMSGAIDDLTNSYKELMTELENLEDLEQNVTDAFLSSIDEVNDALDKNKEAFELVSDQIDHDITMIQKLYGDDAYERMDSYYERQLTNIQAELSAQQNAATYWKQLAENERVAIANGTGNQDALDKYEENWKNAVSNVNSLVENWAEALTTKYENTIDALVKSLNNKVSNNKGLDYLDEQLTLLSSNADNYLDTINAAYAKQQLQNKWQDAINDTDSVSIQKKLNDLMQQQMDMLEQKGQLTQYDIDRAEKEYEIALKQIALQEAQQSKSKMRLKRDANGNYSYQFVSDEDTVRQAQQELADAQNSLYNFDKDAYKNNLNDMYSTWNEFQEKIAQAYKDYADDQDALQEHIALLQEQYGEKINYLTEQNLNIRNNLTDSAFNDLANLYNIDVSNFQNMTQEEQDLIMNGLVPEWDSGVQQMIDKFSGDGGFEQVCQETFDKLGEAAQDYIKNLEDIGQTNDKISNEAYDQSQKLLEESNQLIDSARQEYQAIGDIVSQVNELIASYRTAKTEAIAATKAAFEFVQAKNAQDAAKAAEEQKKNQEAAAAAAKANAASSNSSSSSSGGGTGNGAEKDGVASVGDTVGYNGKYYYDSNGKAPAGSKYSGVSDGVVIDKMNNNSYGVHIHSADGKYGDLGWVKKSQLFGYDTGGYTGSWGSDGRLALLHQKELVLNKDDTENMLAAMQVLRGIVTGIGENVINNTSYLLSSIGSRVNIPDSGDTLEQTVYINAKFEGQTEANEIETALRNLVNTASQRVYRNKK